MDQCSSMQLQGEVKIEEADDGSFSAATVNPVTALKGQPSIKEEADQPLMIKTEPSDHHGDIEGIEYNSNTQLESEVKREDSDTVFSTATYNPVWTSLEHTSIQDETVKPMTMKTETDDHDTYEPATQSLPQVTQCKNENRNSFSLTGDCKDKDANMMVSYTHNQSCQDASEKVLIFKAETGVLCDVIELTQPQGLITSKEKGFKCDKCEFSFADSNTLSRHQRIHSGKKLFQCNQCEYSCFLESNLMRHVKSHSGAKLELYKCTKCEYKCMEREQLAKHNKEHVGLKDSLDSHKQTQERSFLCNKCKQGFSCLTDLKLHKQIHLGNNPFKCGECGCQCYSQSHLKTHQKMHIRSYKCDVCDKCFGKKNILVSHNRIHIGEKPYKCNQCEYSCSHRNSLLVHKRTHTGEKPFKCNECDKYFSQSGHLVSHVRTHTGVKPFKCDECDKCFSERDYLVTHKRTHTGEKPFKCKECDKYFAQSGHLVSHVRTHTGVKPFKCNECDKCFSQKGHLVGHNKTHTGEKPYKCNQCEYSSTQNHALMTHQRKHTGEKPYKCNQCDYSCYYSNGLARHKQKCIEGKK